MPDEDTDSTAPVVASPSKYKKIAVIALLFAESVVFCVTVSLSLMLIIAAIALELTVAIVLTDTSPAFLATLGHYLTPDHYVAFLSQGVVAGVACLALVASRSWLEGLIVTSGNLTLLNESFGSIGASVVSRYPRNSFWGAFPFAALVFFLVCTVVVFGVASEAAGEQPEHLLLRLVLSLAAAVVTGIVVLYGAHLVVFEGKIAQLTKRSTIVGAAITQKGDVLLTSTEKLDRASKKNEQSLLASQAAMREIEKFVRVSGVAVQALESDGDYRRATQSLPIDEPMDRYIEARSAQMMMSNDAICLNRDNTIIDDAYLYATRNMIASFLGEMAWDLGERRLLTNAGNYTGFLVGAARGFEARLDDYDKKHREANPGASHRVFYLTHTLVHPAHLLNWPGLFLDRAGSVRSCACDPFMLEYMTYCRYFAANKEKFVHARAIRCRPMVPRDKWIGDDPSLFTTAQVDGEQPPGFPTHCWARGVPLALPIWVGETPISSYPHERIWRGLPEIKWPVDGADCGALFASMQRHGVMDRPRIVDPEADARGIFWPLFIQRVNAPEKHANGTAQSVAVRAALLEKVFSHDDLAIMWSYFENAGEKLEARSDILKGTLYALQDEIKTKIGGNYWKTKTDYYNDAKRAVERAEWFLDRYEAQMLPLRWGYHGRGTTPGGDPKAYDMWESVRIGMMTMINTILGEVSVETDECVPFPKWFRENFHTTSRLLYPYAPDEAQIGDALWIRELANGVYGSESEREHARVQWGALAEKEFALIGIIDVDGWEKEQIPTGIADALRQWATDPANGNKRIRAIKGLTSTIASPWKHAEIAWYLPCKVGRPVLRSMAMYYSGIMSR